MGRRSVTYPHGFKGHVGCAALDRDSCALAAVDLHTAGRLRSGLRGHSFGHCACRAGADLRFASPIGESGSLMTLHYKQSNFREPLERNVPALHETVSMVRLRYVVPTAVLS